ncbi:SDR family oxidoreductase [Pseudoflavitalea sp. X16]|uniref:SDR family oxidoreductase n=1 Tax=Paraflavitalea devenefica TaxID=2716334 RepID=UPI0014212FEB|nr:SDR family oxidoreductase [Paraflavitalea devenefica]NII27684.1 SDR family oxidoreductase [Paraflavitalea devenefica]
MILVTGATGHLGTATIEHLLKNTKADKVIALARNEEKATALRDKGVEVRIGDFDDTASLDKAMQGIEKVLLISTIDHNHFQQHKNVVDAARKAGVRHIAYTSISMKDVNTSSIKDFMESHFRTEDYIRESGLAFTLLRNTLYTDVIPWYVGEHVFERGIYFPAGTGTVPFALRSEMGEAAANVLLQDGHENKTYSITGNNLYSFGDIASELSTLSGKTVAYTEANATDYVNQLKQFGVPESFVFLLGGFGADIKDKQFEIVSNDLENLLGRKPASLKEGLKAIYRL